MEAKRPFSQLDWLSTPQPVKDYIIYLEKTIFQMQQQLGQLEKATGLYEIAGLPGYQTRDRVTLKNKVARFFLCWMLSKQKRQHSWGGYVWI